MKILILGGIAESKDLAIRLIKQQHQIVYSIVGLVREPNLDCEIHVGGFRSDTQNGVEGLVSFCQTNRIELLIDSTHPYAVEISSNAVSAAKHAGIECWRFDRPGWQSSDYLNWNSFNDINDLFPLINAFSKPFFSIGQSALQYYALKPVHQEWVIRSAKPFADLPGIIQINAIGPFHLEDELELLSSNAIDCLISKNSGCNRVSAKMDAAQQLGIPAFVQLRPELDPADRTYGEIEPLVAAIT